MRLLAGLTPKELRALERALKARIARRTAAIATATADRSAQQLRLGGVRSEIERRERSAAANRGISRKRKTK